MHFLILLLLFKIAPSFVCSSCHYLNYLKKLYLYMSLFFTVAIIKMEEICCCYSTLHISSSHSDCSAGLFSPHSAWSLKFVVPEASSNGHDNGTTRDSLGGNTYMLQIEVFASVGTEEKARQWLPFVLYFSHNNHSIHNQLLLQLFVSGINHN